VKAFNQMQNPSWRWVYGILATYGLRNHEVFHLDIDSLKDADGIIKILAGKTGGRTVCPIYPEWIDQFNLREPCVPKVSGKTNSALGARVTQSFKRAKMPFDPYDLRHAWAVRSIEFGMDVSLAAQQMGHSLSVHSELYHAWISESRHRQVFHRLMERDDRPKPPLV
jgi:integrase